MTVFKFLLLPSPEATPDNRLFYQQIFPQEIRPVQHGDSSPGFPLCGYLHEGNTSRLVSWLVRYNLDKHDTSGFGENGFEFKFADLGREVGYINFLFIFPPWISLSC